MLQVIGIKKQEGDYNGNPYRNYVLYVVDNDNIGNVVCGVCPQTIKIKQSFFKEDYDISQLYQRNIVVYYDSYGHPVKLEVAK